jgi:hypothetical protein
MMPRVTNTSMSRAVSAITTRSHASTRLAPPPGRRAVDGAMTGFSQSRIDVTSRCQPRRISGDVAERAVGRVVGARRLRLLRAAQARAGAEVLLAGAGEHDARTPSVAESSSNTSARWSRMSGVSELPGVRPVAA